MSFEVYLQCHERGELGRLPRDGVRRLFPVVEEESDPNQWTVRYDEFNVCTIYVGAPAADDSVVHDLCISRPPGVLQFWNAVFDIMQMGSVVFFFPGNAPPLVAREETTADLPPDMVMSLGKPRVVRSGQQVLETVQKN